MTTETMQCSSPRLPKKPRLNTSTKKTEETVLESKVLLQAILSFVPGTFRFTAAVNQKFRKAYLSAHGPDSKRTSFRDALQAVTTARIWAAEQQQTQGRNLCDWPARYGTLAVLQDLRLHGKHGWSSKTCEWAAARGHLETLMWARDHGCRWCERTSSMAAKNGHLDVLIWARDHGCSWDEATCYNAALNGHLDVLKWARDNGCPWDEATCYNAALNGHLDFLKWARDHGCPWNEATPILVIMRP
jgi:hypothetical protein